MNQILADLPKYVELICQLAGAISIVATIIVRMTPSQKDDEAVINWIAKMQRFISFLPTWGINPRTKKLEEALKDLNEKEKS